MVLPDHADPEDPKEKEVLQEIWDHLGLKAMRAPKDQRVILVNLSQLLRLCHLRCPWW